MNYKVELVRQSNMSVYFAGKYDIDSLHIQKTLATA